jgi:ABC-2 type transport system permease protein
MALLLISSVVMLGGGALIFGVQWQHPVALVALTIGYAAFVAGLMAVLVGLVPDERRGNAINTMVGMALGLAGGCAFPAQALPSFLRENISPLLPTYWLVETVRNLEFGDARVSWLLVFVRLVILAATGIVLAAFLYRRRFSRGLRT